MGRRRGGDALTGRQSRWNNEISLCRPDGRRDGFFRNGEGDEVSRPRGRVGRPIFGELRAAGRLRQPRHDVPVRARRRRPALRRADSPGLIEIPRRYRNEYGQLSTRRTTTATSILRPIQHHRERGEFHVKRRARLQTYVLDYHPFDVVGWDGYLYPWTFSVHDFEPITGRIHQPPPSHQTFQGRNFVICSFCPRKLDFDPLAVPIPYHHSNLQSEEMIYYVSGKFGSRRSRTLHLGFAWAGAGSRRSRSA
jgi:homogentisate 1,2-dioxygenase